ncbi:MurR/RpiR family transcriptional regulator [Thorsellia anophelis]|uniref:Transcriptional regulator, RpiR family n=1 Tax=Thorsellia anophelis DSM 18579 TaxID=1123402 RepID=A0A1I0D124_9GAMM|nr:MurR/RpiR family transcriptional regulator [Thorsellia anophelis]SET25860.1 transcriptional regulator, RpiR family [Thorsellia anophelis DSM 18579]
MIKVDGAGLNPLEKVIFSDSKLHIRSNSSIKITELAHQLNVSPSKISKFVRKLGFDSFKQYKEFIKVDESLQIKQRQDSNELARIAKYISSFDNSLVEAFWYKLSACNKLIIYGIGPSFIVAEYFAYRLRIASNIFVLATNEETVVRNSDKEDTKLLILSTTGQFKSFEDDIAGLNYNEIIFLFEELRFFEGLRDHTIYYLTQASGDNSLKPYEKSRTLFFIFLEEVIQKFLLKAKL